MEGRSVVPWEYRAGARSWLIPLLLAGPMALGQALAPDSELLLLLPKLLLVLLSLAIPTAAILLGGRVSREQAIAGGLAAAIWYEQVYFAARALSEPIAVAPALLGFALALRARERADGGGDGRRMLIAAGALMGLALAVRFHYAPALLVLAVAACGTRWRSAWLPLAIGAGGASAAAGLVDVLMGDLPFAWAVRNLWINVVLQRSHHYGVEPWDWYLWEYARQWRVALVLVPLALVGARRHPALLAAALVNIAIHSLLAHKEYRFVLLSSTLLIILAGFGTADLLRRAQARWGERGWRNGIALAVLLWTSLSAVHALTPPFARQWKAHRSLIDAMQRARDVPGLCGLALYRPGAVLGAAQLLYRRRAPVLVFAEGDPRRLLAAHGASVNAILAPYAVRGDLAPPWRFHGCTQRLMPGKSPPAYCLFTRTGTCTATAPAEFEINQVLIRRDE